MISATEYIIQLLIYVYSHTIICSLKMYELNISIVETFTLYNDIVRKLDHLLTG